MPKLREPRYTLYRKLVVSEYFIPNFKHKYPALKYPNILYTQKPWPTLKSLSTG